MEILRAANAEIAMRRILQAAVSEKASDVHLEPCREFVLVRFRIDGTLTERYRLPPDMAAGLSVRAKVLGGMDVGENRIPQDGSFSEIRDEKKYRFPSFRDAFGLRGNDRHTDFIGADGFH